MRRMAKNLQQGQVVLHNGRERAVSSVENRGDLAVVSFADVGGLMVAGSRDYIYLVAKETT